MNKIALFMASIRVKLSSVRKKVISFCLTISLEDLSRDASLQRPVVRRLDNFILWINCSPVDKHSQNKLRYALDRDLSGTSRYPLFEQPGREV